MAPKTDPVDTGNDDKSGEPVRNRAEGHDARPPGYEEEPSGDRGAASGKNQEQMDAVLRDSPASARR